MESLVLGEDLCRLCHGGVAFQRELPQGSLFREIFFEELVDFDEALQVEDVL